MPNALAAGIAYSDFWKMTFKEYKIVCEAFQKREAEKMQIVNFQAWLQGMYIYHALCDVSPLFRFSTKSQRAHPYLEEPIAVTQEEMEERKVRDERRRFEKMKAKMESWVTKTNVKEVEINGSGQ